MSDDEVIRFEITDYDLDNEFNPNRGRRGKKEQQIYGCWAKDSDEEDNEDNVRQRLRKPKDFSAPIGFVAGGVQQAGKKKENAKEIESAEPSSSRAALIHGDSSSDEERPELPDERETAGIRRKGQGMTSANLGGNVGAWEKHTKGIGAKLLLQMGYKPGKGLGKDLQGISAPVEATLRKGRGAIGAYGPEKSALKAKKEEERRLKDKEKEEGKDKPQKSYHWKKSHKGRYFYRDASDVIQEGVPTVPPISSGESAAAAVPVLDLRGREARLLSGYGALRALAPRFEHEPRRALSHFAAPELAHNLQLMVTCCEQDIIQNAHELQRAEDEIVVLERDMKALTSQETELDEIIEKMEELTAAVEELNKPDISLDALYEVLFNIKEKYPLEYEMFGLGSIAGGAVSPLLSAALATWEPLSEPARPVALFLEWSPLLSEEAYGQLVCHLILPAVERAAAAWNPREPEPLLRVYAAWERAWPEWARRESLARAAVPRLLAAARLWDPTRDVQPLHEWVLPWHAAAAPALHQRLYPEVRAKLAAALAGWHPSDGSALPLLAAWRHAWGGALDALVARHVEPALEAALAAAPVAGAAAAGATQAWGWCAAWAALVSPARLAALASRALLPRWLAALAAWLNTAPPPPHADVLHAYTSFKQIFSEDILKEPVVRDIFRKALDMMNRSADLDTIDIPPPPVFTLPEPKETTKIAEVMNSLNQQKSFSELLEFKCEERGITFLPMQGKSREGRPVFKIGSTMQCYVIRNVIMYSNDSGRTFLPISMEKLLAMAED